MKLWTTRNWFTCLTTVDRRVQIITEVALQISAATTVMLPENIEHEIHGV